MSILDVFFPTAAKVVEAQSEAKNSKKEVERLEKKVQELRDDIRDLHREHSDENYSQNRQFNREMAELEDDKTDEIRDLKKEIAGLENDVEAAEERATQKVSSKIATLEIEAKTAGATARLEAEEGFAKERVTLRGQIEDARVEAAQFKAESETKDTVIENLEEQLDSFKEFTQFVLGKIPDVDLSKFNISIDVPPAEVTVVSAGGNNGGNKGEKKN